MGKMGKIFVTGANGFIGKNLSNFLENLGYSVTRSDISGDVDIKVDLRNANWEEYSLDDYLAVVHLGAKISVPESFEKPRLYREINVNASRRLFQSCSDAGVPRIVFASSAAVYGEVEGGLMTVGFEGEHDSPYAETKILGEEIAKEIATESTKITCLRFFNVYGPGQQHFSPYASVIPIFIDRMRTKDDILIFGDGEQTRDFIHVDDICRTISNSFAFDLPTYSRFNLGTGTSVSINAVVMYLREIFSNFGIEVGNVINSTPREGDILHSVAELSTNAPFFEINDKTALYDGLRDLVRRTLDESDA